MSPDSTSPTAHMTIIRQAMCPKLHSCGQVTKCASFSSNKELSGPGNPGCTSAGNEEYKDHVCSHVGHQGEAKPGLKLAQFHSMLFDNLCLRV